MKVEEKALRKMMDAIGMPVAAKVPLPRLQKKVNILDKMLGDIKDTPEGDDLTLFRSVCAALEEGDRIVVVPSKKGNGLADTSEEEDEEREETQVVEDQEGEKEVGPTSEDSEVSDEESSNQESEEEGESMARPAVQDIEDLEDDREEVEDEEGLVDTDELESEEDEDEEAPKPKKKEKKPTKKASTNKVKGKPGPKPKVKKPKEDVEEAEDGLEDPEEPPQKPAKKAKKAKAGEDTPKPKKAKEDGQVKGKGGPRSAGKDGKPGIIGSIVEFLKRGSEDKPLTKKKVVELLAKRFPDRDPESMAKTVSAQIGYHLFKFKNIEVSTDGEGGYWIE